MNSPFGPTPDPYTTPPQWLPPGALLNYVQPSTGGGSGSGSGGGGGSFPGSGGPPAPGGTASNGSQNGSPMFDLFGTSAGYIAARQPAGQNSMTSYYIKEYNATRVDLYFNDFSAGMDAQLRQIGSGAFTNETGQEGALAAFSRTLMLPPLITVDATSANEIGELDALSSCYLNDGGTARWLVAGGDVQDKCLFAMGSSLTTQTYNPGANIISLTTVKIATNTERVIVGREGTTAQVLTSFGGTPTVSGTMHANTSSLWGAIRTTLNSTTPGAENILLYCNGGLYILSSTAAISDAPTAVLTNWPNGGYAVGIVTLTTNNVALAYWAHPLNSSSTSVLTDGKPIKIVSTNLEGLDPKEVDMGMPFLIHALKWRNGIVGTDGKQVIWNNGDLVNLGWNRERDWGFTGGSARSANVATIQCLAVVGDRLFACVSSLTSAGNYNTLTNWEEFIPETNSWKFYCKAVRAAGEFPNVSKFTGETPVYRPHDTVVDTGTFWWYTRVDGGLSAATYEWGSAPLVPSGINPYYTQEEGAWVSWHFATTGELRTPTYLFGGLPMVVSDVWYGGELNGTGSQVDIEFAVQGTSAMQFDDETGIDTQKATFKQGIDWQRNWWVNRNAEGSMSDRLKMRITLTQATSGTYKTNTSPNALPFRVGLYVFHDGKFKEPKMMEPWRYWGNLE